MAPIPSHVPSHVYNPYAKKFVPIKKLNPEENDGTKNCKCFNSFCIFFCMFSNPINCIYSSISFMGFHFSQSSIWFSFIFLGSSFYLVVFLLVIWTSHLGSLVGISVL